MRRGRLGPRPQGTGAEGDTGGRTRGTRRKAGSGGEGPASTRSRGHGDGGEGAARGPENTRTQPGHQENQRGIPPPPTHEGGPATPGTPAVPGHPWSGPHTPAPPPGPACRPPTFLHPSILNRSVFRLSLTPRLNILGTHSRARAAQTGPTTPPPAAAQGRGRAQQAPPHHGCGAGGAGADQAVAPQRPPPFPLGSHHGAGCAQHSTHTAPHSPDTRQGPAGPSPNSEGGGAGRSRQQAAHGPTAGPAHPSPPFPTGGGGFCPRALAVATVATAHSGGAAAGGSGTPRLPLGSLEKAFSPRAHRPSPDRLSFGPTEAHQEPPLNWAGGVCGIGKRTTTQERVRDQGPLQGLIQSAATTRGAHNASLTVSTPPMGHTHTTVVGTQGGHRVKGKRHHHSASGT